MAITGRAHQFGHERVIGREVVAPYEKDLPFFDYSRTKGC
ncbi:hypothetical protein SBDP1_40019 [Syntrophobacter sp. SbD1]|nr:hypothetical protein SBDP1_40019 [Syntrophobacter sp. SbD1]